MNQECIWWMNIFEYYVIRDPAVISISLVFFHLLVDITYVYWPYMFWPYMSWPCVPWLLCTDTSSSNIGSNAAVVSLTKEIEKAKEKAEQQEVKLKQAAEFISYQEEQISTLSKDIEELNTQLESSSVKRLVLCSRCYRCLLLYHLLLYCMYCWWDAGLKVFLVCRNYDLECLFCSIFVIFFLIC